MSPDAAMGAEMSALPSAGAGGVSMTAAAVAAPELAAAVL